MIIDCGFADAGAADAGPTRSVHLARPDLKEPYRPTVERLRDGCGNRLGKAIGSVILAFPEPVDAASPAEQLPDNLDRVQDRARKRGCQE